MFFCNPFDQNARRKEENDDGGSPFRLFLIDNGNIPWMPSFDNTSRSNSPIRKPTSSFSTRSTVTFDGTEDHFGRPNRSSDFTIFRQRPSPTSPTRPSTRLQRIKWFLKLLILLSCITIPGILLLQQHWSNTNTTALESFINDTGRIKSAAVRIWNDAVPSTRKLMATTGTCIGASIEILHKIPGGITSLFQWDEVDEAIIDWIKSTIMLLAKKSLNMGRETVTL